MESALGSAFLKVGGVASSGRILCLNFPTVCCLAHSLNRLLKTSTAAL